MLLALALPTRAQQTDDGWAPKEAPLMTRWADDVSPDDAWPEYPRPQMVRDDWHNLNGLWQFAFADEDDDLPFGEQLDRQILVPFAPESALSGIMEHSERVVYRRTFDVPAAWRGQRVLLHFSASDWETDVYVNGEQVGTHRGGYDPFTFDITDALDGDGAQELVVRVYDPTDEGDQARGKQVLDPRGIWYTPVTGIWQTVWLEPVPTSHIADFTLVPDIKEDELRVTIEGDGTTNRHRVTAVAMADGEEVGRAEGPVGEELTVPVPSARLWSPDDPYLYDLRLELTDSGKQVDVVDSYFGMREAEVREDEDGVPRLFLNGEFVFQVGPLDQGYWPDGLYTAPTDEALRFDLVKTKELGFNMNRKHVKVEPARWYYWADRLGILVWQDMPNGDNTTPESREQFEEELADMVDAFRNHPSIIMWVVFNEGWGQYDAARITEDVQELDPNRLVMDVSGWQHAGAGDVLDVHRYQGPTAMEPEPGKASVVGEFGGLGLAIEGHTWAGEGWGYEGTFETREALAERFELLLNRMWRLRETAGMSAGVYTQLTDVEREVNGLFTYDRDVLKVDAYRLASVNQGRTPFILPDGRNFIDEVEVRIADWTGDSEIHYTLDGTAPTPESPRYTEPFTVDETTTVRAQAFCDGRPTSYVSGATLEKVERRQSEARPDGLVQGLDYRYFERAARQRHQYAEHWPLRQLAAGMAADEEADKAGTVEALTLAPAQRDELYAFVFDGYLEVPETGVYTFYIHADDGAKIFLGGEQVSDRMGQSPKTTTTTTRVALQEGLHPLQVNYFQAYGPSELEIEIEGPGIERQPLPTSMLYRQASGR